MVDQKQKYHMFRLPDGREVKANILTREDMAQRIAEFETKYGMTSQEFMGKWTRGELDCAVLDYFRWESYCRKVFKQGWAKSEVEY